MKKLLFFGVICLLFSGTINAQVRPANFFENTNISFSGGVNSYNSDYHKMFSSIGGGGEISFGKWVSNCIGFRIQFGVSIFQNEGVWDSTHYSEEEWLALNPYDPDFNPEVSCRTGVYSVSTFTADMAILFDPFHTMLRRFNPAAPRGFFICGLGYIGSFAGMYASTNDFLVYLAYHQEFIKFGSSRGFAGAFFIEPKATFLQPDVLSNPSTSVLLSASVGLTLKFNPVLRPVMYRPRSVINRSKFWQEDWYIGVGIGASSLHYNGISSFEQRMRQVTPAVQLTLGKYNSPCISTRLQTEFGTLGIEDQNVVGSNKQRHLGYNYTHADVAFNLSKMIRNGGLSSRGTLQNTISSYRMGRSSFWQRSHFEPFAGLGMIYRMGDSWSFAAHAGLRYRWIVSEHSEMWIEGRYTQLMNRFIGGENEPVKTLEPQTIVSVRYPSIMLGYNFNIGYQNYRN